MSHATLSERQHDLMHQVLWAKRCRDVYTAWAAAGYAGPVPTDHGPEEVLTEYLTRRRMEEVERGRKK